MFSVGTDLRARFARRIILISSLVLGLSVWGLCQGQQGVDVSFALQNSSVTLHEPVVINLSIHNDLAEQASLDLGYDREGNFQFSIV